jgi:hypothetical protein
VNFRHVPVHTAGDSFIIPAPAQFIPTSTFNKIYQYKGTVS